MIVLTNLGKCRLCIYFRS